MTTTKPTTAITAIDLFAGAGGFTAGAEQAGLDVLLAANHWPQAVATHELNHPGTEHTCQDIRQMDFRRLPDFDVLLASPACQGHSSAGQPGRAASGAAAEKHSADRNTAWAVIECADVKAPRAIVVENVPRFLEWRLFPGWVRLLEAMGYHVTTTVIDAADLGVPQNRRRAIVTAGLEGPIEVAQPELDHTPIEAVLTDTDQGWAPVSSKPVGVQRRVAKGRERHGQRFITQHVTNHPGRALSRPLGTVTTASQHWHLVDGPDIRALTPGELAAAQGFPAGYQLPEGVSLATRLIGNAIPPALARHAAEATLGAIA